MIYNRKIKNLCTKTKQPQQSKKKIYLPYLWTIKAYISLFINNIQITNRNMTYNPVEKVEKGCEEAIYKKQYK